MAASQDPTRDDHDVDLAFIAINVMLLPKSAADSLRVLEKARRFVEDIYGIAPQDDLPKN